MRAGALLCCTGELAGERRGGVLFGELWFREIFRVKAADVCGP